MAIRMIGVLPSLVLFNDSLYWYIITTCISIIALQIKHTKGMALGNVSNNLVLQNCGIQGGRCMIRRQDGNANSTSISYEGKSQRNGGND